MEFIQYMIQNKEQILSLVTEHIELTAIAVGCSILVGVPLGILISPFLCWESVPCRLL